MLNIKIKTKWKRDDKAASPVIGVMLMIVVTVILAAAVTSYSGGIAKPTAVAPSGSWDVKIRNTGEYKDSGVWMTYLSGDPIPSKDIKIVMEHKGNVTEAIPNVMNVNYINKNVADFYNITNNTPGIESVNVSVKVKYDYIDGSNETEPWADANVSLWNSTGEFGYGYTNADGWANFTVNGGWNTSDNYWITIEADPETSVVLTSPTFTPIAGNSTIIEFEGSGYKYSSPIGYVNDTDDYTGVLPYDVWFGNYTIESGVMLKASPNWNYDGYEYGVKYGKYVAEGTDPVEALLNDWQWVRPGDTVSVQIIHIPSGKAIFKSDVIVEG